MQKKKEFHIGYIIYDDSGKIFAYSDNFEKKIATIVDADKNHYFNEIENDISESELYIIKECFGAENIEELKNNFVSYQGGRPKSFIKSKNIILSRIQSYLYVSKTSKEHIDLSNLHILIFDPIYYFENNLETPCQLENTIFEFNLNN